MKDTNFANAEKALEITIELTFIVAGDEVLRSCST